MDSELVVLQNKVKELAQSIQGQGELFQLLCDIEYNLRECIYIVRTNGQSI